MADQRTGSYRFRHALLHEAVLDEILPGELDRLHGAYASALAERQADGGAGDEGWARLAHHWAAAADYDAALGAAVRAGRAAEAAVAMPEAHRYLEWSVRLWDRAADPEAAATCDRGTLLAQAADAASRGGAVVRALTLVDEALATPQVAADPVRAGLLHERRGWYLFRSGRPDEALAASELAVGLVPASPPSEARARVVQALAHALVRTGQNDKARPHAEDAAAMARALGDVVDEGQAVHVLGLVAASEGRTDEAVTALTRPGRSRRRPATCRRWRAPTCTCGARWSRPGGRPRWSTCCWPSYPRRRRGLRPRRSWAAWAPGRCTSWADGTRPTGCWATRAPRTRPAG